MIIGIGNPDCGDDGAGHAVVSALENGVLARGEATELLGLWEGQPRVIVIDAVVSGAAPGTVHRIDARRQSLPAFWQGTSTHGFGLAEAIELARLLDTLPGELVIYGIEAARCAPGTGLSPAVRAAVTRLVRELTRAPERAARAIGRG